MLIKWRSMIPKVATTSILLICCVNFDTVEAFSLCKHVNRNRSTQILKHSTPINNVESISEDTQQVSRTHLHYPKQERQNRELSTIFGVMLGFLTVIIPMQPSTWSVANAAESKVVGSLSGSGLFFKDTLQVEAFDDPKVQGVKLFVSNFILPLNERLSSTKNLFSDPTSASLTCAKTGPIKVADNIGKGSSGEQVFEESKSLLFKSLKVQRIYDEEDQTLIYVSYNTRLDKNDDSNKSRFKSSLCAIGLE
jgi:CreA protein